MKLCKEIRFRSQWLGQKEEIIQISTRGRRIRTCIWKASDSFSSELTWLQLDGPNGGGLGEENWEDTAYII